MMKFCHKKIHFVSKKTKAEAKLQNLVGKNIYVPIVIWQSMVPTQTTILTKGKLGVGGFNHMNQLGKAK
jgi:hypothetical protein